MKRIFTITLFTALISANLQAQEWEAGIWGGVANYFGDLNTNTSFEFVGPATGVFARYNAGSRFAVKTGLNFGIVAFDDATSPHNYQNRRNLSFKSKIYESSTHIEFNFFKYVRYKEELSFTPYLLTGFSLFYFNPQAEVGGAWVDLRPLQTEGESYSSINFAIPIGGGFKYSFTPFWTLAIEIANRKTFTDYLDDVSDEYIDQSAYQAANGDPGQNLADPSGEVGEPIGRDGQQRGFRNKSDDFLMIGISISYAFRKVKCPKPGTLFN